jgi:SWI/SNF chromatin-remodeling complex subunit SWI1
MSGSGFDPSPYLNLDPSQAAKQIAALNAASQARIANSRPAPQLNLSGGTNSAPFLGGINSTNYAAANHDLLPNSSASHTTFPMPHNHGLPPTPNSASFLDPSMSQPSVAARNPQHPSTSLKQRQQGFLHGLANVMAKRGTPLPPALTGVPVPNYDPATSIWKGIEPSSEVGSFRLAGNDIDLFKLWGLVFQNGGGSVVCQLSFSCFIPAVHILPPSRSRLTTDGLQFWPNSAFLGRFPHISPFRKPLANAI